mgnify:FL=1
MPVASNEYILILRKELTDVMNFVYFCTQI